MDILIHRVIMCKVGVIKKKSITNIRRESLILQQNKINNIRISDKMVKSRIRNPSEIKIIRSFSILF